MYFFTWLASCMVDVFNLLNRLIIPGFNLGFGYILVGLTMLAAIFKFILVVSGVDIGIVSSDSRERDGGGITIINSPGAAAAQNK